MFSIWCDFINWVMKNQLLSSFAVINKSYLIIKDNKIILIHWYFIKAVLYDWLNKFSLCNWTIQRDFLKWKFDWWINHNQGVKTLKIILKISHLKCKKNIHKVIDLFILHSFLLHQIYHLLKTSSFHRVWMNTFVKVSIIIFIFKALHDCVHAANATDK